MIVGFLNQKGGVGKTTLTLNLAAALARAGNRVLVIDADPQCSALDWSTARKVEQTFAVIGLPRPTIHKDIHELSKGFDHVLIDGPPRVTDLARSVIMACDLICIPVQPSPLDVWASEEVVKLLNESLVYKPTLKSVFTINRKIVNTAIGRDVAFALAEYAFPVMESAIAQRVIFAETAAIGKSVFDQEPNGQAAAEIQALVREVFGV